MLFNRRTFIPIIIAYCIGFACLLYATNIHSLLSTTNDMHGNEDALASEMSSLIKQVTRMRADDGLIRRFNQPKSLGCFNGEFTVKNDIPSELKQGIFAKTAAYPAFVRFANASTMSDTEKDLRGLSIRVGQIEGQTHWGGAEAQDFVLNSHPVLFARSPEEFRDFIIAQRDDSILSYFLNPLDSHLKALMILLNARDNHTSPFDIRFWSTTPFRHGGEETAVKYSVKPCSDYQSPEPAEYTENYLREAMHTHLEQHPVCFDFMVQTQGDPKQMPIEDPTVEWDEDVSPFVAIAQLTFSAQEFMTEEALEACEIVSFNPWQGLEVHQPLGRMNYVRRQIYAELSNFRENMNGTE